MAVTAVLTKTGPDTWAAFGGAYTVERGHRGGEVVYRVTTERFAARPRHANCTTLAGAREACGAWEHTRGLSWYPESGD